MDLAVGSTFHVIGSYDPIREYSLGDIVIANGEVMCYMPGGWEPISTSMTEEPHAIRTTKCNGCGAPLDLRYVRENGTSHCDYCGSFTYVW